MGTPILNPEKGPKSEENEPPPIIRRLATHSQDQHRQVYVCVCVAVF